MLKGRKRIQVGLRLIPMAESLFCDVTNHLFIVAHISPSYLSIASFGNRPLNVNSALDIISGSNE